MLLRWTIIFVYKQWTVNVITILCLSLHVTNVYNAIVLDRFVEKDIVTLYRLADNFKHGKTLILFVN